MISAIGTKFSPTNNRNKNNHVSFGYGRQIRTALMKLVTDGVDTVSESLKKRAVKDLRRNGGDKKCARSTVEETLNGGMARFRRLKTGLVGTPAERLRPDDCEKLVGDSMNFSVLTTGGKKCSMLRINKDGTVTPLVYDPAVKQLIPDEQVGKLPVAELTRINDAEGLFVITSRTQEQENHLLESIFDALFGREKEALRPNPGHSPRDKKLQLV